LGKHTNVFDDKIEGHHKKGRTICRMPYDQQRDSATEHGAQSTGAYAAGAAIDDELGTMVLSLTYEDKQNPARNIALGIAPDLGSNLFRFRVGEHDLVYTQQDLLKRMDFTGNFVLWPIPNRVRDKRYAFNGHEYSLEDVKRQQGNAVLIHGLVLDRPWQYERPLAGPDGASVTTYVDITPESAFYTAYPFPSRLSLTYRLTGQGVSISYRVENKGNATLPYGFALHPYFSRLSGDEDTLVSLPAEAVMESDDELLPTGRVFDVNKIMYAMYDLREPLPVGSLKLDHVYTDVTPGANAVIDYRKQGIQLLISTSDEFTHIVIYTPAGTPSFCVEHQTCSSDALNLHNQGPERSKLAHLLELQPGEVGSGSIHYTVNFYQ
jgi:aldose 1-epimerase